ncbi:glycosyltransferase [Halobacteria archaeon HArc-gm2]|nr:glycosyltransferase [Halobacteria archaeon HArc-gm2]
MNILQVTSGYPPTYRSGGAARSAKDLSEGLVERGHSVTVYTTTLSENGENDIRQEEVINGVTVKRFRLLSQSLAYNQKMPMAPMMYNSIRKNRDEFDIAHIHEFRTIQALFLYHGSRELPYVLEPRGEVPINTKAMMKNAFDKVGGKSILRTSARIIAASNIEADQIKSHLTDQSNPEISLVPNGIDLEKHHYVEPDRDFQEKYGISDHDTNILFLSRLSKRKGLDVLLESYNEVYEEFEDPNLIIAGPDEGALASTNALVDELGLDEFVTITGPLYDTEKLMAYSTADLFVLPSTDKQESFGRVVLEALACGTPVVVTNVCGVGEWLQSEYVTVTPPRIDRMAEGLRTTLTKATHSDVKAELREDLAELSWSGVAKRTEDVYDEVLGGGSNR